MNQNQSISFIYKRNKIKSSSTEDIYVYEFDSVKEGDEIIDLTNNLCFNDREDHVYGHIEDMFFKDDELVYSFPINVSNLSKEEMSSLLKKIKKEIYHLKAYPLVQTYRKDTNEVKTYSVDPNNSDNIISVQTNNENGLKSILTNEFDYIEEAKDAIKEMARSPQIAVIKRPLVYSDDIYEEVSKTVICQDKQIKSIAASIAKNQRITDPILKDNLLICGPTGVGKTEIFRCIEKLTSLPLSVEDSTEYTANGFKGKDITDILYNLYMTAEGDIEKAQRGIILMDEIDKKVSTRSEVEVYTSAVISSLLKMSEGHVYHVEKNGNSFDIDTSFITFAMCGAFSGIEALSEKRRSLGFITDEEKMEQNKTCNTYTNATLQKYGVMPEFIGRNKLVVMNALKEEEFAKIINMSDKSALLLYKYLLESMGIDFICEEGTIEAIAKKAVELGVGARSIKKIIENALELINYDIFSKKQYSTLIISPETIEDNTKYILK